MSLSISKVSSDELRFLAPYPELVELPVVPPELSAERLPMFWLSTFTSAGIVSPISLWSV